MKRTILFINGHLDAGGCERSLADVLKNINYDKYEVDLLLLEHRGDYLEEIPKEVNIKLYSLDNTFGSLIPCLKQAIKQHDWFSFSFRVEYMLGKKVSRFFLGKLKKLFRELKDCYDVIVAYRPGICTELAAFTFDGKKKITWWHHGIMNFSGIALEELRKSYQKMDCVVAVSKSSRALLTENFSDMKEKFTVIPNMIIPHELSQKAKLYEAAEFQDTAFKIITVGRMSAEKNMMLCPEVAAVLKKKGINFKWVLIGDGEEERYISSMIVKYNLQENVIMLGRSKNPYPYIAAADLMIHPSLVESQGITILESMALATPVIAVDSAGPKEFIISGINGYLVVPEIDEIVKLIKKVYKDSELRERLVENAIETVRRFEPQYIIKQVENILEA